jgi:hypothetical protein
VAHFYGIANPYDFWALPRQARELMKAYAWAKADMEAVEAYEREKETEAQRSRPETSPPRARKSGR